MKNILITAGGTVEPIDSARVISNSGTGRLGSLIADEFAKRMETGRIIYVCADNAMLPQSGKAEVIKIRSVDDLAGAVESITKRTRIDVIIHSMAVSDYSVRSVTTAGELARYLSKVMSRMSEMTLPVNAEKLENDPSSNEGVLEACILAAIENTDIREGEEKLSSKMKAPVLLLEQTPKVLASMRSFAPDAVIVGFKLLTGVPKTELIETAKRLMINNSCDFVLANDSQYIHGDEHLGLLIDRNGSVVEYTTKQSIASGIVSRVLEEKQ